MNQRRGKKKNYGEGSQPSLSQAEQASHCSVFGCSCVVFLPDGPSMSARENNIWQSSTERSSGWPRVHGQTADSWRESITRESDGGLQVRHSPRAAASKRGGGGIRRPRGCTYQDRALIYCKQCQTPGTRCINQAAAATPGDRASIRQCVRDTWREFLSFPALAA